MTDEAKDNDEQLFCKEKGIEINCAKKQWFHIIYFRYEISKTSSYMRENRSEQKNASRIVEIISTSLYLSMHIP